MSFCDFSVSPVLEGLPGNDKATQLCMGKGAVPALSQSSAAGVKSSSLRIEIR